MEAADDLCCIVCHERYCEELLPRVLMCGHSICTPCVAQLITRKAKCPECRRKITVTSVADLPVSYPLLRLARDYLTATAKPSATQYQPDAGECVDHKSPMCYYCQSCEEHVCKECLMLNHNSAPAGKCQIITVLEALEAKKNAQLQKSVANASELQKMKDSVADKLSKLQEQEMVHLAKTETYKMKMLDEEEKAKAIQVQIKETIEHEKEIENLVRSASESKDNIVKATTVQDVNSTVDTDLRVIADVASFKTRTEQQNIIHFASLSLDESLDMEALFEMGRDIYAVREEEGQQECCQVTLLEQDCHLHALQSHPPPPHALTIPWRWMRRLVPDDSPVTFLDVALAGELQGRLYITMFDDTPRGRQFTYLCMGEFRHSYKGNKCSFVNNINRPGESILISGCTHNNGTPIAPLVEELTEFGVYKRNVVPGLVVGPRLYFRDQTLFGICTNEDKGKFNRAAFGQVSSGLDILYKVIHHKPLSEIMIQDCGVVFQI